MSCDFSLLHKFNLEDTYIVLDINSGIVHSLSREAYAYLEAWEAAAGDTEAAMLQLTGLCEREELEEIKRGFEKLREEGLLFGRAEGLDSYEVREEDAFIKALCLHVAHDCNLRCRYCFAGTGAFGGSRTLMSLETGRRALDFLFMASGPRKHVEVDYFGGEPLLNYDVLKELIEYGRIKAARSNKELKQTVTTNALLLNQEKIDYFNSRGIYMILSLDGRPEVHNKLRPFPGRKDSYAAVTKGIKLFSAGEGAGNSFVRGTYTHFNTDFCADVEHLLGLGLDRISLEPVVAPPDQDYALTENDLPALMEQYEKLAALWLARYQEGKPFNFFHFNISLDQGPCLPKRLSGCGAGYEYAAVSPEGDLYPCHQFVGQKQFKLGTVFTDLSNHELSKTFQNAHVLNKKACQNCWARFFCSGGCHANAYNFNRDILEPYQLGCQLQKKRLECALYLQVKLAESAEKSEN